MFTNHNPVIVQIRRELRERLPDSWSEEIIAIAEYQLSYQTLDDLLTEDLLKLKIASAFSPTLKQRLDQGVQQQTRHRPATPVESSPKLFGKPLHWF